MTDLAQVFASLQRAHVATRGCPLPACAPGLTWIVAANGLFKRGTNTYVDALIPVKAWADLGGDLVHLRASVRWRHHRGRLPGSLLAAVLAHARQATTTEGGSVHAIEQFYVIGWDSARLTLFRPKQAGSAAHVRYELPPHIIVLADMHSHHLLPAFFSATDDQDDSGLSVSVVVGRVLDPCPDVICRINVHGHRHIVPVSTLFENSPHVTDVGVES